MQFNIPTLWFIACQTCFFFRATFIFNLNYVTFAWKSIHKNLINFSGGFRIDETLSRLTWVGLMDDRDLYLIIFFIKYKTPVRCGVIPTIVCAKKAEGVFFYLIHYLHIEIIYINKFISYTNSINLIFGKYFSCLTFLSCTLSWERYVYEKLWWTISYVSISCNVMLMKTK